jgi:hypothetical protein
MPSRLDDVDLIPGRMTRRERGAEAGVMRALAGSGFTSSAVDLSGRWTRDRTGHGLDDQKIGGACD